MLNPAVSVCGHTNCRGCLETVRESSTPHCPTCRRDIEELQTNWLVREMVRELKCQCKLCLSTFTVEVGITHKSSCDEMDVECENLGCSQVVKRKDSRHHEGVCEFRLESCPECKIAVPLSELDNHKRHDCANRELKCPLGCPASVKRNEVNMHTISACSEKQKRCEIPNCLFWGNDETLEIHQKIKAEQHVQMLQVEEERIKEKMLSKRYEVKREPKFLEKFDWTITGFKRTVCENPMDVVPMTSPEFVGYGSRRWRMMVFSSRAHYKLFAQLVSSAAPVRVRLRFTAEPCDGVSEQLFLTMDEVLLKEGESYGEYIPRTCIEKLTETNDFLQFSLFIETCTLKIV